MNFRFRAASAEEAVAVFQSGVDTLLKGGATRFPTEMYVWRPRANAYKNDTLVGVYSFGVWVGAAEHDAQFNPQML